MSIEQMAKDKKVPSSSSSKLVGPTIKTHFPSHIRKPVYSTATGSWTGHASFPDSNVSGEGYSITPSPLTSHIIALEDTPTYKALQEQIPLEFKKGSAGPRALNWIFTFPNPPVIPFDFRVILGASYVVAQLEKGSKTGLIHYQCYAQFPKEVNRWAIQKPLNCKVHCYIQAARENARARHYCMKPVPNCACDKCQEEMANPTKQSDAVEYGLFSEYNPGKRTDIIEASDAIFAGATLDSMCRGSSHENRGVIAKYDRFLTRCRNSQNRIDSPREVTIERLTNEEWRAKKLTYDPAVTYEVRNVDNINYEGYDKQTEIMIPCHGVAPEDWYEPGIRYLNCKGSAVPSMVKTVFIYW